MQTVDNKNRPYYLVCERQWVYHLLIIVAGYFGAFTYLLRGNVFCNAQTGNVVLMGLAVGCLLPDSDFCLSGRSVCLRAAAQSGQAPSADAVGYHADRD